MRTVCGLSSVLLLMATGCTYNPVRYDPASGFQSGGGVGVLCGGPLDPWMNHCGPGYGCGLCGCLESCCCDNACAPACPPAVPVCPPMCPAPVCPPMCPAPVCPPAGIPFGTMQNFPMSGPMLNMPSAPFGVPGMVSPGPVPTFAEPSCPTCGPNPAMGLTAPPQAYGNPYPGATNYSQLFHSPPMAPPAMSYGNQFLMPTPLDPSEIPSGDPMPPHYEDMETPARQEPTPANMPPMSTTNPMPQAAPMNTQPMNTQPMNTQPMPMGPEAMRWPAQQIMVPTTMHQGVMQPGNGQYIDSRHQTNHLRL